MEKKFFYASTAGRLGMSKEAMATHWEHAIPVYRNAPHVWNVGGQDNVASFLIDTGAGQRSASQVFLISLSISSSVMVFSPLTQFKRSRTPLIAFS